MARPAEVFVRTLRGKERRWLRSLRRRGPEFVSAVMVRRAQVVDMSSRGYSAPEIADALDATGDCGQVLKLLGGRDRLSRGLRSAQALSDKSSAFSHRPTHRRRTDLWAKPASQIVVPPEPVARCTCQQRCIGCRHAHAHEVLAQ